MPVSTATLSQIQETAARLRKAVEKENNYVEFDTKLPLHTNRGNKLKRKAELYRDGQLGGQRPFKKVCRADVNTGYPSDSVNRK